MNVKQQQEMIQSKRLILTRKRKFNHYYDAWLLSIIPIALIATIVYVSLTREFKGNPWFLLFGLIFPLMAVGAFVFKYRGLNLIELPTGFSKQVNYVIVKEAIVLLSWKVKVD